MDDYQTMYGFLSPYEQTVFVHRVEFYTFKRSPVIYHTTTSGFPPVTVSLRECMLYFGRLASRDWQYRDGRIGPRLVSRLFYLIFIAM